MTIVEKKSRIVVIIAESTRDNMQRAFNTSLTPMLESILGVSAGELSEFQAIMDKAMPQIGSAMNDIFNQELIGHLVAPVLDGYSEEQIDQIYQMVSNPMYKNFMGEMTVGMVQSPAYMSGVVQIGPKVEAILQSVWEELHPPKTAKEQMHEAADALLQSPAVDHLPQ